MIGISNINNMHNFWSIVVVENNLVWVVVKCWGVDNHWNEAKSEVYVRSYNGIKTYPNSEVKQFIFDKEISDEDMEFYE